MITNEQRRARLGVRHALAVPAENPVDAADRVVALHATDPASIFLSVHARVRGATVAHVEQAMFDDRTLMRTLAMRRTLFVASEVVLPLIEVSASTDVARKERRALVGFLRQSGLDSPEEWLDDAFEEVLTALDGAGGQSARRITEMVPRLATRIILGSGKYTQEAGATSRVLGLMAVEGLLARGRPNGRWTGRQYVWHRRDQWLPLVTPRPSETDAAAELLRRWLRSFGPGTMTDLRWWTGWTKAKVTSALATLEVVEVDLEAGSTGFVLTDDLDVFDVPDPWVALLPGLDPTPMGWKEREWYVGPHIAELFDRNGNIGPTIWADGRIVGVWTSRGDGTLVTELFDPIDDLYLELLSSRLEELSTFIGDAVIKPSFPTPMQKRLASLV